MFARSQLGVFAAAFALFTSGCESQSVPVKPSEHAVQSGSSSASSASSVAGAPSSSPVATEPLLDFATLPRDAKDLDGKRVRVVGEVFAGAFALLFDDRGAANSFTIRMPVCTELECSEENPCCNRCGSAVSLRGDKLMGVTLVSKSASSRYACGGTGSDGSGAKCSMDCTPKSGRYEAVGVFHLKPDGETQLEVERLTAL
ncbi:MAG: hypothetical protein U0271_36245 [Polyangiaceae bacterium]